MFLFKIVCAVMCFIGFESICKYSLAGADQDLVEEQPNVHLSKLGILRSRLSIESAITLLTRQGQKARLFIFIIGLANNTEASRSLPNTEADAEHLASCRGWEVGVCALHT